MMLHFRGSDYRRSRDSTWYNRMDNLLMALGFTDSKADSNLCFKVEGRILVMLLLYVNDLFLTGKDKLIRDARRRLTFEFDIKDLAMMHYFLGMEVWQNVDGISLGQGKYTIEILKNIQHDGLQGHDHTYGIEPEAIE